MSSTSPAPDPAELCPGPVVGVLFVLPGVLRVVAVVLIEDDSDALVDSLMLTGTPLWSPIAHPLNARIAASSAE